VDERGSALTQSIFAAVIVAIALIAIGWMVSSRATLQGRTGAAPISASNVNAELQAVLENDNTLSAQTDLQSGAPQTFTINGGGSVTVSTQGSQAVVTAPDGTLVAPLVSSAAGN
jgi:hypothetical protein